MKKAPDGAFNSLIKNFKRMPIRYPPIMQSTHQVMGFVGQPSPIIVAQFLSLQVTKLGQPPFV